MDEKDIINNLLNLDFKAAEVNENRKKQLTDLNKKYREEEQKIIQNYKAQTDEEIRNIIQKGKQETELAIKQSKLDSKILLENMKQKFDKNLTHIVEEIIEQIFKTDREDNG